MVWFTSHFSKEHAVGLEPTTKKVTYLREFRISSFCIYLMPKLVAWKPAKQGQALGPTVLLQLIHLAVVPDLTASEHDHIHNKQFRAPQE